MPRNSLSRSFSRGARMGFRASRGLATASAWSSGDPGRIARRYRNKLVGRAIARTGIWGKW